MLRRVAKLGIAAAVAWKGYEIISYLADEDHSFDKTGKKDRRKGRKLPPQAPLGNTGLFANREGLLIYWRRWLPPPGALTKGIVILTHGLGEHCGRYEVVGSGLASPGFAVYALDHQGHGRSEGDRLVVKPDRLHGFVCAGLAPSIRLRIDLSFHACK